jgi:hypothetical protein
MNAEMVRMILIGLRPATVPFPNALTNALWKALICVCCSFNWKQLVCVLESSVSLEEPSFFPAEVRVALLEAAACCRTGLDSNVTEKTIKWLRTLGWDITNELLARGWFWSPWYRRLVFESGEDRQHSLLQMSNEGISMAAGPGMSPRMVAAGWTRHEWQGSIGD